VEQGIDTKMVSGKANQEIDWQNETQAGQKEESPQAEMGGRQTNET